METRRQEWNQRQKALRQALAQRGQQVQALDLFLSQHAQVHTAAIAPQSGLWSFADEVWQGLDEAALRRIPSGEAHSIAWLFWHLARIEDVTMNLLLAGGSQVFTDGWQERLKIDTCETGNHTLPDEVAALSAAIDLDALWAYRLTVGCRTREVVCQLPAEELRSKVSAQRLQRLNDERAVRPSAGDLLEYWGGLTLAGLLLMPPTRHNFVHLNEGLRIRGRRN